MATATKNESAETGIVKHIRKNALGVEPDTDRYKCRFFVAGSTGTRHKIAFDAAPGAGYWRCSCMGGIRHGQCKHLTAMGLQGRKFGKSMKWVKHFRFGG